MCKKIWLMGRSAYVIFLCIFSLSATSMASAQDAAHSVLPQEKTAIQTGRPTTLTWLMTLYPAGAIKTMEGAKRAGDDVHAVRAMVEAQFIGEQKACFHKFFATACVDEAKERHRNAVIQLRLVDIEANQFKRRAQAIEREKANENKRNKESVLTPSSGETSQRQNNPSLVSASAVSSSISEVNEATALQEKASKVDRRAIEHRAATKQRSAAEAEKAEQRAKNIAEYEKKTQESDARQRKIAAKKLEKERAHSTKEASPPP